MKSCATDRAVLVIGYGNTLRGDDGAGVAVAERLDEQGVPARVVATHQLTPELSQMLAEAELAVFIDATEGPQPGRVRCREVAPQPGATVSALDHHLTPGVLLAWARELYGHAPRAVVVTIDGEFWGYRSELSPKVLAAVGQAEAAVRDMIRRRRELNPGSQEMSHA
jgi:hydrogenase maturation protease